MSAPGGHSSDCDDIRGCDWSDQANAELSLADVTVTCGLGPWGAATSDKIR